MSGAFEAAWAVFKSDVHIRGDGHAGHFNQKGKIGDRYEGDLFMDGRDMRMHPVFGLRRTPFNEKGQRMNNRFIDKEPTQFDVVSPFEFKDGKMQYLGEDFDTRGFYRGGSMPRLQPDGSYVGVNLSVNRGHGRNFRDKSFDEAADSFASTAAHENVHYLIDDEIKDWARQQTGLEDAHKVAVAKKKEIEDGGDFPPIDESDIFADIERENAINDAFASTAEAKALKEAQERFQTLGSIGHESGAYMLTPNRGYDNLQQVADHLAQAQDTYPAGAYTAEGGPGLSALHSAGPSEDQLTYQQKLQEQQNSVGVQ